MAEVKGSCARVASRRLVPEHLGRSPTSASGGPLLRLLVPGVRAATPCDAICTQHPRQKLESFLLRFNIGYYLSAFLHERLHSSTP